MSKIIQKPVLSSASRKYLYCMAPMLMLTACAGMQVGGDTAKPIAELDAISASLSPSEREALKRVYREGERNAVLNFNELGIAALEAQHFSMAELSFDEAIQRIERIYANDANAKKAKSVFAAERVKDFKGEPYERAMAYYYRGLLHARAGDYQNARASFLSADYQDTVAEKEEYQGDFGLMNYLAAWSSSCDGDKPKAMDLLKSGIQKDPSIGALSAVKPMLYIFETGQGPMKGTAGKQREVLTFSPRAGAIDIPKPIASTKNGSATWVKSGDVVYQALTRGGRPIQGIMNGKAQMKEGTEVAGGAMLEVGTQSALLGAFAGNDSMASAGSAMAGLGALISLVSNAMVATADTREWVSLPEAVYLYEESVLPATSTLAKTQFISSSGGGGEAVMQYWGKQGSCAVAWGRSRTNQIDQDNRKLEVSNKPRDDNFRKELIQKLASQETKS